MAKKRKQLVGKAALTQARTTTGRIAFIRKGFPAPGDLTDEDRTRLTKEGYLHEVEILVEDGDDTPAPNSVEGILATVGDDKAKAAEALEAEKSTAKPRTTLLDGLQAVIDKEA